MSNYRRNTKRGFAIFVIVALLAYGLFQSKKLLEGPQLTILEPIDGATLSQDLVTIKGVAKNIAYIKLNDRPIFVNDKGQFTEVLLVAKGYSIIKVSVQDKFGKVREQFIHVVLPKSSLPEPSVSSNATSTTASSTGVH